MAVNGGFADAELDPDLPLCEALVMQVGHLLGRSVLHVLKCPESYAVTGLKPRLEGPKVITVKAAGLGKIHLEAASVGRAPSIRPRHTRKLARRIHRRVIAGQSSHVITHQLIQGGVVRAGRTGVPCERSLRQRSE